MSAAKIDIKIEQGSRFNEPFTWKDDDGNPIDLSGYGGKMTIRKAKDKSADEIHSCDYSDGDLTLTSGGVIRPFIAASDTANFNFDRAFYDILLTPPSGTQYNTRVVQGVVTLDKQSTVI